jgi:ABC-2 type transport system permease protein
LAAFGTMSAMLSGGARIANERQVGWNRQLRIAPLSPRAYFRTKLLAAYLMAILTMVLLYASGLSIGVSLTAAQWLRMTLLPIGGRLPFAALGIWLRHLLSADAACPARA